MEELRPIVASINSRIRIATLLVHIIISLGIPRCILGTTGSTQGNLSGGTTINICLIDAREVASVSDSTTNYTIFQLFITQWLPFCSDQGNIVLTIWYKLFNLW